MIASAVLRVCVSLTLVEMTSSAFPVLWLGGPPGVGKSTVAWELFAGLARAGVAVSYVDIDQLAMCYPAPSDDPWRDGMKTRNVSAVVTNARSAGARCVIVSGVVDVDAVGGYVEALDDATVTWCLLPVDRVQIAERLAQRSWSDEAIAESLQNAASMDGSRFADVTVNTAGLTVGEAAGLVRDRVDWWPTLEAMVATAPALPDRRKQTVTAAAGQVLWVCGPTGVGKSSVGWSIYQSVLADGHTAAFVDLGQLGFSHPAPLDDPGNHRIKAVGLATMWNTFQASGADCLIVNGQVDTAEEFLRYSKALPAASITLCRLRVGRDTLTQRILQRGQPGGLELAGNELVGQPDVVLQQAIERAVMTGRQLERGQIGDLVIDTDGRTPDELARLIRSLAGDWPRGAAERG